MKANVGGIDRVLRIVIGLALIGWVYLQMARFGPGLA